MHPQRTSRRLWLILASIVIIGACIGAAFFFGETSPLVAKGRVKLAPELVAQSKGIHTLYIIVRDADSPMPMPWGAMSVTLPSDVGEDVYAFTLTRDNLRVMNPSVAPPKNLTIKARLDLDGLGGADMPGDLTGSVVGVPFGSQDVTVNIDHLVGEGGPAPSP